jgi:voltage-gated potassium channel
MAPPVDRKPAVPGKTPHPDPGKWSWSLFAHVFTKTFVLASFMGLIFLELMEKPLGWLAGMDGFRFDVRILPVALLNGLLLSLVTWLFLDLLQRSARRRRRLRLNTDISGATKHAAVLTAFISGALDVLYLLTWIGLLVFTAVTLVMVFVNTRRFLRLVRRILRPGQYPEWADLLDMAHVYISMIITFTLINVTLVIFHLQLGIAARPFNFAGEYPGTSVLDYFYFSVVVMTTLGFGDVTPATPWAKLLISLECLLSYIMFGLMLGMITRGIIYERNVEDDQRDEGDHPPPAD